MTSGKTDLQNFRGSRSISSAFTLLVLVSSLVACLPASLSAQTSSGSPAPPTTGEYGGYQVQGAIEVGGRATGIVGSGNMYDTLVNLQSGPRFLSESLSMQSIDHQGLLFDDLYLDSFGWGGDPNNALTLRASKDKWYNLQGHFRRDQNHSDFDLLANPLNPPTSKPSIPALNSPHLFDTVRRMSDVDLTLLPEAWVSFRLGYSHNNMTGPSYSSVHEGTDALLLQPWNTTLNSYRVGVDARVAPRTVLSFDEFLDYYRGDTDAQLAPFAPALLSSGTPVELGLSIDTANRAPCAVVPPATSLISNGTLTNVSCSAYFSYLRNQRVRTSAPTERISFRSSYFQRLNLVGSYAYSSATMSTPLYESFDGLMTRTSTRAFTVTGLADANRISDTADFGATLHLTPHLRLINQFYFWAYRIPENGNFSEVDSVCTGTCNLLTPLSATSATTTPTVQQASFNQTLKRNQTQLAWDFPKKAGASIGFRYGNRVFNHFNDFLPGDLDHFEINEFTALAGVWFRPTRELRMNFDMEHSNFDNLIVRIAPRKETRYRLQSNYTPRPWATVGGSINLVQDSNADSLTNYVAHNQNYGLTASLTPKERFGVDVAYNYNSVIQNALICFNDTPPTGVTLPFVAGATSCAGNDPGNPLLNNSYYTNHTQFGMASVRFVPHPRLTANVGLNVTGVDGRIPQFNILQPLGSLDYIFIQPAVNLSVDLGHKLAWNTAWNYYQYNEGSFAGPTAPRYFHANLLTESLRYAF